MLETSAVQNSFSNKSLLWSAAETLESTMLESVMLQIGSNWNNPRAAAAAYQLTKPEQTERRARPISWLLVTKPEQTARRARPISSTVVSRSQTLTETLDLDSSLL